MGAAPSHVTASHSFSDGTAITVIVSTLGEVTAETEPRKKRTLLLSYEVRDRDHPECLYDFDHEAFELRRANLGNEIQGLNDVVAWLDRGWSEEGYENFPINFLDVFVRMVTNAITTTWGISYTILVTAVIDVRVELVEELRLEPASEAAVAALERVFVAGGDTTLCAICLEEFSFKIEALSMPCSHVFHQACIVEWLSKRSTCPMCRFELPVDLLVSG